MNGFQGPVVALNRPGGGAGAGVGAAELDPLFQRRDLGFGELLLRRHLELFILILNGPDEEALLGMKGNDGRAGVAAL